MADLQDRLVGAFELRNSTFENVRLDRTSIQQAGIVVAAGALSTGLGSIFSAGSTATVALFVFVLLGWGVGSTSVWLVGTRLFPGHHRQVTVLQVAAAVGFAQAPYLFGILTIIPFLGGLIGLAIGLWALAAVVVAVKQVFGYHDIMKAAVTCLAAAVPTFIVMAVLVTLLAVPLGVGSLLAS